MAIDVYNILLRTLVDANYTTKGSPLTWDEEDTNFKILGDAIKELQTPNTGSFTPYNAGTTYSNVAPDYVSYDGNVWEFISATPTSGVTPGTNPLVWSSVSLGQFSHVQNTDQYLDFGGAYQVSAAELFALVSAPLTDYLPLDGSEPMTGDLDMDGNDILDVNFIQVNTTDASAPIVSAADNGAGNYAAKFIGNSSGAAFVCVEQADPTTGQGISITTPNSGLNQWASYANISAGTLADMIIYALSLQISSKIVDGGLTQSIDPNNRYFYDFDGNEVFNWRTDLTLTFQKLNGILTNYADNAAAITGGLTTGDFYRTGGAVMVVI